MIAVKYVKDTNVKLAQSAGFEPARAEPNGFLVHRLNHSATTATLAKRDAYWRLLDQFA